ncbi:MULTISPECIES: 50S ribosomal protein L32 [Allobranchiibius]|uniref:Large ribosomal subunit protein bL32 n=1 Tax=Allobranchiibius huperziae TaxID=1874116 RepID=A0A853DBS8_9MICO|nr:50S ribosomal protein L32 [Allobranchiibius sp. GilTou73]MBO1765593.1 50S ribosomal protein L32 [Allobranchiibius sp. GilTou38]NYJ74057.1 large subunit ribosomal protein L32 [Allobranchiibius huperziae]UIJ34537.1 50S ribosomal protein L32 [Allobranchiibius sp. GilTou73]
MAVPKRKMSRSNTRSRRANWKATPVAVSSCPVCNELKQPHLACPSCGSYNGRQYPDAVRAEHQA